MKGVIPKVFGSKIVGKFSGRFFDPTKIGMPVRRLSSDNIRIKHHAIDVVEKHLRRFRLLPEKPERVMLERLRQIADRKLPATNQDLNFYAHELREFVRYRQLGFADGKGDDYDLWNDLHTATLEDYGLRENLDDINKNPLYHREAAMFLRL